MRKTTLAFGFWPGLPGLIRHGRGVFLTIALGFGLIASMTLFACGCWTELISRESKLWLCGGLTLCWGVLTLVASELTRFFDRRLAYDEDGDRFLLALNAYMAGRWPEAEKVARAILRRNKRDPEVLLLLATLYRHQGRPEEATEILDRLDRLETAEKWSYEIAVERRALAEPAEDEETEEKTTASEIEDVAEKTKEAAPDAWSEEEDPAAIPLRTTIPFPVPVDASETFPTRQTSLMER